jgi:uncharacterized protein (TIGR00106 family)
MVLLDFRIFPIGQGVSLSFYVAKSLDIIDRSGLDYRCHAMGTTLEGEFDAVMGVVKECFEAMAGECDRVACSIEIDYRKDRDRRLEAKVASVERQLGRAVRK